MTESDQIQLARQGNANAWEKLVLEHQDAVFRLAYLLIGDPDDAQDIAQESFIRAYYALDRFDTARPFRPWILRITTNLARNRHRSFGRYMATLTRFARNDFANPGHAMLDQQAQTDDSRSLWQAIRSLNHPFQEVLYMRFFLEMTESEMAGTLGVAPGTVKSRLSRALRNLRNVIEREYPHLKDALQA